METLKEYVLGERPPRLDAVVLKKRNDVHLTDAVGSFFRSVNVLEFKGYDDGISINDFYKAQAYAILYMTTDRKVNEIPPDTVTVTVMQHRRPKAVLETLASRGCDIIEREPGILEVKGSQTLFPYQIVNVSKLDDAWTTFKPIVPGATREQAVTVLNAYEHATNSLLRDHLADVIRTGADSNPALFSDIRRKGIMKDTIREVFGEELAHEREEPIVNMLKDKIPRAPSPAGTTIRETRS